MAAERDATRLVQAGLAQLNASCDALRSQRDAAEHKSDALRARLDAVNSDIAACASAVDARGAAAEAWAHNAAAHEADLVTLESYTRRDEKRVKDVQLALERTCEAAAEAQHQVQAAAGDVQAAQTELEAARDELRSALASCEAVRETVQDAIRRRQHVQTEISGVEAVASTERADLHRLASEVDASDGQAAAAAAAERDAKRQMGAVQRGCDRLRASVGHDVTALDDAESQLASVRRALARCTADARAEVAGAASAAARLEAASRKLEDTTRALEAAREAQHVKAFMVQTLDNKVASLEKLLAEEQGTLERMRTEHVHALTAAKAAADAAADAARSAADMDASLAGCAASTRAAVGRIAALDKEQQRAGEVLHAVTAKHEATQRTWAHAQGVRTEDETKELGARIVALEQLLAERSQERNTAAAAVLAAREALAGATSTAGELHGEVDALTSQVASLRVEADGAARAAKEAARLREEAALQAALRRAELRRLRGACAAAQATRAQAAARKTAAASVGAATRAACAQRLATARSDVRDASDRLSEATAAAREVKLRAETLQRRYESMLSKRVATDSEPRTQEWYLAQAAQQKSELEAQATALGEEVAAAEQSVATMEAALAQMSLQNSELKHKTLGGPVVEDSPAVREKQQALEGAVAELRALRHEESDAASALGALRDALASCAAARDDIETGAAQQASGWNRESRTKVDLDTRLARARARCEKLVKQQPAAAVAVARHVMARQAVRDAKEVMVAECGRAGVDGLLLLEQLRQL